jgi:hypothetical protein
MSRLVREIDILLFVAAFGRALRSSRAPSQVLRPWRSTTISVAAPVLSTADIWTTKFWSKGAKSQEHLLAISRRRAPGKP